jgi:hypothetical protein
MMRACTLALIVFVAACSDGPSFREEDPVFPPEETMVARAVEVLGTQLAAARPSEPIPIDVMSAVLRSGAGQTTVAGQPLAPSMQAMAMRMDYASAIHALVAWTAQGTVVVVLIPPRVKGYADGLADFAADTRAHAFIVEGQNAVWRAEQGTASIALQTTAGTCPREFALGDHACKEARYGVQLNVSSATPWQELPGNTASGTRAVAIDGPIVKGAFVAGPYVGLN